MLESDRLTKDSESGCFDPVIRQPLECSGENPGLIARGLLFSVARNENHFHSCGEPTAVHVVQQLIIRRRADLL